MSDTASETVRRARQAIADARSGHYLSGFRESTQLLEEACDELAALLPASRLERLPDAQREQMRVELQLLSAELARSEAIHRQAGSLRLEWARLFTEAGTTATLAFGQDVGSTINAMR